MIIAVIMIIANIYRVLCKMPGTALSAFIHVLTHFVFLQPYKVLLLFSSFCT